MPRDLNLQGHTDADAAQGVYRFKPGQRLFKNQYELVREIGAGGMGVVWLARDLVEGEACALKFVHSLIVRQEKEMERLREEVKAGKSLRHPRLVATYGLEIEDSIAAVVMEYVEGETLKEKLEKHPRGFFEPEEIEGWVRDIADGLTYLHEEAKRVHRDLKPANVMTGTDGRARLMDFGISHRLKESLSQHSLTTQEVVDAGSSSTLAYASPQQIAGRSATAADDIYGFGALMYELLTGTPPFFRGAAAVVAVQIQTQPVPPLMERRRELVEDRKYADVGADIPGGWEHAVQWCLAKERADRCPSAAEVLKRIAKLYFAPSTQAPGSAAVPGRPHQPKPTQLKPASEREVRLTPVVVEPLETAALPGGRRSKAPAVILCLLIAGLLGGWGLWKKWQPEQTSASDQARQLEAAKTKTDAAEDIIARKNAEEKERAAQPQPSPRPPSSPAAVNPFDSGAVGSIVTATLPGSVELKLCYCPPGNFTMGSPPGERGREEDEKQVSVTLTKGFWLAQTEFTQVQWESVMGGNPSPRKISTHPAVSVTWDNVQTFLKKLNGLNLLPPGWQWALPTEAQWEYACRAGTTTPFSFGEVLTAELANFGNSLYGTATEGPNPRRTSPAGSYQPNAWGFFDMHGNVYEWCQDWHADGLSGGTDPPGAASGSVRVIRGGAYYCVGERCRSASRFYFTPGAAADYLGFRPAAVPTAR